MFPSPLSSARVVPRFATSLIGRPSGAREDHVSACRDGLVGSRNLLRPEEVTLDENHSAHAERKESGEHEDA